MQKHASQRVSFLLAQGKVELVLEEYLLVCGQGDKLEGVKPQFQFSTYTEWQHEQTTIQ